MNRSHHAVVWVLLAGVGLCQRLSWGEEPAKQPPPSPASAPAKTGLGDPPGATRLSPQHDVWLDKMRKVVIIDGEVCLREGQLEMFVCIKQTKEHESILTANTKAFMVHAALLALGAQPGKPVQFDPKYVPASGTEVDITLLWIDKDGKKRQARAQDWIRDGNTKKPLTYNWVFAGSGFWEDDETKIKHYLAEGGDFICVSNFPSAMLDLPVESSQSDQARGYECNTENIPPVRTKVRIVLKPKLEAKEQPKKAAAAPKPETK